MLAVSSGARADDGLGRSNRLRGASWRPDIQGLRAVAVIAVVLYHGRLFDAGFVGVDIFFVISGFLISRHLFDAGQSSIGRTLIGFYARRVLRIVPAAAFAIVATLAVGRTVLTPLDWRALGTDGAWSAGFAMNLRLASGGVDYLAASQPPSALQHFWSLGLEEQFYLVWPVVILGVTRLRSSWLVPIMWSLTLASLTWMLMSDPNSASRFYSLTVRGWQLTAGALACYVSIRTSRLPRPRGWVDVIAVGALLLAVIGIDEQTVWPGWRTIPLTVAVMWMLAGSGPRLRSLLSGTIMGWIGDRSYSWYLWHFPPIVFLEVRNGSPIGPVAALVVALATLLGAHVTYTLIEQPVRQIRVRPLVAVVCGLALSIGVAAGAVALSSGVRLTSGVTAVEPAERLGTPIDHRAVLDFEAARDAVPENLDPALGAARDDRHAVYGNGCHVGFPETVADACLIDAGPGQSVLLFGDSHAVNWLPAMSTIARANGLELWSMTKSGCTPADAETYVRQLKSWYTECPIWRASALEVIEQIGVDVVIVTGSSNYLEDRKTAERFSSAEWTDALSATLSRLKTMTKVIYLEDTLTFPADVPGCLSGNLNTAASCTISAEQPGAQAYRTIEREATDRSGIESVASIEIVCGYKRCPVMSGTTLLYRDDDHLTRRGSAGFSEELASALVRAGLPLFDLDS